MSRSAAAPRGVSSSPKSRRDGSRPRKPASPANPAAQGQGHWPDRKGMGRGEPDGERRPSGQSRPPRAGRDAPQPTGPRPPAERPARPSSAGRASHAGAASQRKAEAGRPSVGGPGSSLWTTAERLLPPVPEAARLLLERLPEALRRVRPLSAAHRRSLPDDVAALSQLLTTERAGLQRPYWSSPAAVSAYLYYFLPWNLLRLTRLLAALPLSDPRAAAPAGGQALLLDLGSGPLTLPLALWLARPQWRRAPVQVLAVDTAVQPLELGRDLLAALGELSGEPVWPVRLARAPLERAARAAAPLLAGGRTRPWLVSAANVLNELRFGGHGGHGPHEDADVEAEERPQGCRDERLEALLASLGPLFWERDANSEAGTALADAAGGNSPAKLSPCRSADRSQDGVPVVASGSPCGAASELVSGPDLLVVEPGTRLGGGTVMRLRRLALEGGLRAVAPCPHSAACPLLEERGRGWCHFTFDSGGAPAWLEKISVQARLAKSGLSLAPLLLTPRAAGDAGTVEARGAMAGEGPANRGHGEGGAPSAVTKSLARVLSAPFAVPGLRGEARYACMDEGLALLEDAAGLASGDLVPVRVPERARRDRKSGAVILPAPPKK